MTNTLEWALESPSNFWQWYNDAGTLGAITAIKSYAAKTKPDRAMIAAMAMQGILASGFDFGPIEDVAYISVKYADALIIELNKQP